jgi:glutamate synthase (ferredoxin)
VQVTNPPIDPLREGLVMSLKMRLGARGNLLQPGADAYRQITLDSPVLLETDLDAIKEQSLVATKVCASSMAAWCTHEVLL